MLAMVPLPQKSECTEAALQCTLPQMMMPYSFSLFCRRGRDRLAKADTQGELYETANSKLSGLFADPGSTSRQKTFSFFPVMKPLVRLSSALIKAIPLLRECTTTSTKSTIISLCNVSETDTFFTAKE